VNKYVYNDDDDESMVHSRDRGVHDLDPNGKRIIKRHHNSKVVDSEVMMMMMIMMMNEHV